MSGAPGPDPDSGPGLGEDDVIRMLAAFGDRAPSQVDDVVGSLEVTWLLAEIEQRYGVVVDLDADDMGAIQTVADATRVLGRAVAAAEPEGAVAGTVGAVAGADEGPAPA